MKSTLLFLGFMFSLASSGFGQSANTQEALSITSKGRKTEVRTNSRGKISVNVAARDAQAFQLRGWVGYEDLGAKGDGITDDFDVIVATHAYANQQGLSVKADDNAIYYLSGKKRTAIIQTDTDFGKGIFIIDDTDVEDRTAQVFLVSSTLRPYKLEGISSLKRNQSKIDVTLPATSLITVNDANVRRYIRFGPNQNNGAPQTDIFIVDKLGNVDMDAPIIWDFEQITDITALPMDEKTLTIRGGKFTTIANQAESKYTYYSRGIGIKRSNVLVDGLEHRVTGEGDHGAPYGGFLNVSECAYVTVQNSLLTGHKTYQTIGSAGVSVSMGTYDISLGRALNVSFVNCSQTNDINDTQFWGIMGSNYCKNLILDRCVFSRFDAHMGVANATVKNSILGHQGINAIGSGTFTLENSTVYGRNLINLRSDYGSTWEGELIIKNTVFVPAAGRNVRASLISGSNSGQHDFGYTCFMPERVRIENLRIKDYNHPDDYQGPAIFGNFNPQMTDEGYVEKFPYILTKEVQLENVEIYSGEELRVSDNPFMFRHVRITTE